MRAETIDDIQSVRQNIFYVTFVKHYVMHAYIRERICVFMLMEP